MHVSMQCEYAYSVGKQPSYHARDIVIVAEGGLNRRLLGMGGGAVVNMQDGLSA